MDVHSITSSYIDSFNTDIFLEEFYGCNSLILSDYVKWELNILREFFSNGMVSGERLLDVGTGPSFYTVIAASRHFDNIYISDLTIQNLTVLNKWWTGTISHLNHVIKYCLDLEQCSQTVAERNAEIRQKVKGILSIDVHKKNPFTPNMMGHFDAIVSAFCLECASSNRDEYKAAASNVATLLKENGQLLILGVLEQPSYKVGDFTFKMAALSEKDIREIYKEIGFEVEVFKVFKRKGKPDSHEEFGMVARKIIS